MKDINSLIQKLDTALGKKKTGGGKVDFKALKELKEKSFLKLKPGKHNLLFVCPDGAEDPFVFWGYHNSLEETAYYSVPCNHFNNNEDCTVCKVVDELKTENYETNKHLWFPIRQKIEYYAPVIDIDNLSAGLRWFRVANSVMTQFTEWLRNLEKGEEPFFSETEPQKIIITYDNTASPMEQYKLDKKNFKPLDKEIIAQGKANLKPLTDFMFSKTQENIAKLVDGYFERVVKDVTNDDEDEDSIVEDKLKNVRLVKKP